MKAITWIKPAFLLFTPFLFSACTDDQSVLTNDELSQIIQTDRTTNGYVEWDNVSSLDYKSENDEIKSNIPIPWAPGSSASLGVPYEWIDLQMDDPDPKKRMYSKENGWNLVLSNLMDKTQINKYIALYNRNTGMMRLFFFGREWIQPVNSTVYVGLGIKGSSSLFNFAFTKPKAINQRQNDPSAFFAPIARVSADFSVYGTGYMRYQWYGIEMECAYDPNMIPDNQLIARIFGANTSIDSESVHILDYPYGEIQTAWSDNPRLEFNVPQNSGSAKNSQLCLSFETQKQKLADQLETEIGNGHTFYKSIWDNLVNSCDAITSNPVKAGIESLFNQDGSQAVKALGPLTQSMAGTNTFTHEKNRRTDLDSRFNLIVHETPSPIMAGWERLKPMNLPGSAAPDQLFAEKLGVWNILDLPKVYADMHVTSYFYPKTLIPDATKPVASSVAFELHFENPELCINPDILKDFRIKNVNYDFVCVRQIAYNTMNQLTPYGLYDHLQLYKPEGDFLLLQESTPTDYTALTFDPTTSYDNEWKSVLTPASGKIFCRVSFDLEEKNGNSVQSFSKYFETQSVKRNYYHREAEIEK